MNSKERQAAEQNIRKRFEHISDQLTERSRRLFAANEARVLGYGGMSITQRATGIAISTIIRGIKELETLDKGQQVVKRNQIRREGGGRKRKQEQPGLLEALQQIVESSTVGDPESALLWTARSQRNLVDALAERGFEVSQSVMGRLLKAIGYSRQVNKKKVEGKQHPDRDAQFEHINEELRRQVMAGNPAISVDTKKKGTDW